MLKDNRFWDTQMDLLAQQDYIIIDDFFQPTSLQLIYDFFHQKMKENVFRSALIGQNNEAKEVRAIRNDDIYWLNPSIQELSPIFNTLEVLRLNFNRLLYLSLSGYEFHLAHYPKNSFYKKHLDQFKGRNNRLLSIVIYLNKNWQEKDGGALRIYREEKTIDIAPIENRCVIFRSDHLYHEVLLSHNSRKSLTGWMLYEPANIISKI